MYAGRDNGAVTAVAVLLVLLVIVVAVIVFLVVRIFRQRPQRTDSIGPVSKQRITYHGLLSLS